MASLEQENPVAIAIISSALSSLSLSSSSSSSALPLNNNNILNNNNNVTNINEKNNSSTSSTPLLDFLAEEIEPIASEKNLILLVDREEAHSQAKEERAATTNELSSTSDSAPISGVVTVGSIVEKLVSSLVLQEEEQAGSVDIEEIVSTPSPIVAAAAAAAVADHKSIVVSSRSSSLAGTMFSDVFDGKTSELESGSLEDTCGSLSADGMDRNCKLCTSRLVSPRVLSCLHVFCESCLNKLLLETDVGASAAAAGGGSSASSTSSVAGDLVSPSSSLKLLIECPTCKQVTTIGPKGVESLTCDYILTNILDLSTIESEQLSCTSCKSKEKAISRCSDCANFLCGGCDNAHKYMRCFENHEVVKLEDLQKATTTDKPLTIHKPLFCTVHTAENLKYYCFNCQIPVCNDCLIADHKGSEHHYDVISNAEKSVRGDVENLMKEAKSKVQYCDTAAANLSSALTELQTQHDTARDQIAETYHNYKRILEKCRDSALAELGKLHSERELKIMDLMQNIENTMSKIDGTCAYTNGVLEQANAAEFLLMKKLISAQFINLINNTPKCDINYSLTFDTKVEKFELFARDTFGKFRTESTPPSPKESTPPPTLPGMPPMISGRNGNGGVGERCERGGSNGAMNSSNNSQGQLASSVTASSPISLPTSMQSSFDGDLSVLGNGFMMPSSVLTPDSPPAQQSLHHHHHHQQQQQQQHSQQQQSSSASSGGMHHALQHQHSQPPPQSHAGVNGFNSLGSNVGGMGAGNLSGNNLNALLGVGAGGAMSNGGGSLSNGLGGGPLGQSLNGLNGLNSASNGSSSGGNGPPPAAFNSILEYNLSRLASLTENTPDSLNDALVGGGGGVGSGIGGGGGGGGSSGHSHHHHQQQQQQHQSSIVPSSSSAQNQPITLADILSGDQRAFNNLQALAKLGLNNNANNPHSHSPPPMLFDVGKLNVDFHTDMQSNHQILSSGPSPVGIVDLLPDFCLPATTPPAGLPLTPMGGGVGSVDDMSITNFHAGATPGSTSIVTGRNKATAMQIRCKFGSLGTSKGQFNSPHGFCLGVDEEIIVADTNNHRIEVFDKTGTLKFQFGVPGKEEGQLWYPRKVAVMHTNGKFVVCDRGNERSRMQIFSKCGHFMRKIAIRYIDIVAGLAVTSKGHIVAVDSVSPTVFVISEDGELVRWFDCSDYMREPSDIAIRDNDFYVCDFKGHCVAVFQEDGTFQYRIGNEKVTCFPNGIDISNAGDILIGDSHGNRFHVACYSRDGVLQSEFECPHVKVSRCCGLKITSEGYVVTLAKNNHHVLVLNTLYVH